MRNVRILVTLVTLLAAVPAFAQPQLSLAEAIARARSQNPDSGIAAAEEREAAERVKQARAGYLPTVDLSTSWDRGNQPAFVFSSLTAQRRFTTADFALDAINHPAPMTNLRSVLSIEQPLFDRVIPAQVRAAGAAREAASARSRVVSSDLAMAVTETFGRALIAAALEQSADAAVETARADRELARNRRDAGRVTDADVLQLDVYLARALERRVQAIADGRIARAELNRLMGEPLATVFSLELPAQDRGSTSFDTAALEDEAIKQRPEVALARQQQRMASVAVDAARASFLPRVVAQAGWEWNGRNLNSQSSSWFVSGAARINVFRGFADKARLAEGRALASRRSLEVTKAETQVRLDVTIALARLEMARSSEAAGRASATWARESQRIIRDRYESGLVDVAVLLRAADAVQQAEAQHSAALVNVLTATASLQRAIGSL